MNDTPAISPFDWAIVAAYVVFALWVGVKYSKRAGQNVDEFFLSGRRLPWWIAGTSMVATTFASDTPLVITGWVRDSGIWMNWYWWCLAAGGMLTVFLFSRYWRRGEVMTTAELAELRYGGAEARVLRGFLGFYQAAITNTIILCWVILAAAKIMDVLFDVDKTASVAIACLLALAYSMMAGFWGVVVTDMVQFVMAMVGSVTLAIFSWRAVGGASGVLAAAEKGEGGFTPETLAFFPHAGGAGEPFWTVSLAAVCVFLGVQWWANDQVDGGSLAVQRISAAKSERDGMLACLWYNIAHYGLRPWPWILVALASLIVLPNLEVLAPVDGTVTRYEDGVMSIRADGSGEQVDVRILDHPGATADWSPDQILVKPLGEARARPDDPGASSTDAFVRQGDVLAKTDSERAYVVMMRRFLPTGLLGLAIAALLAAFMSTVDTHVNLASSFFVNDIYRRFLVPHRRPRHYVFAARLASAGVLAVAGFLAYHAESISNLFTFFLAFLSGVGPIYMLRWLWWRVRAATEIVAMISSSLAATWLTFGEQIANFLQVHRGWDAPVRWAAYSWELGPLSPGGELAPAGRLILVVCFSGLCSIASILLLKKPDPGKLLVFYKRVRPLGWWGPVRQHGRVDTPVPSAMPTVVGVIGGLALIYGMLFGLGGWLLDRSTLALGWLGLAVIGKELVSWSLGKLQEETPPPADDAAPPDDGDGLATEG